MGVREEGSPEQEVVGLGLDPAPWDSRLLAARPRGEACRERRLLNSEDVPPGGENCITGTRI